VESTKEAWLNQDCLINNEEENDKTVKNDDGDHIDEDVATVRSADLDVKRNNDEIEHSGVEVTRNNATNLIVVPPFQCSSEDEDTNAQSANLPTDQTQKLSEAENCREKEQLLDNTEEKKCESDFENVNTGSDIVKESPIQGKNCPTNSITGNSKVSAGKPGSSLQQKKTTLKSLNAPSVSKIQDIGEMHFPAETRKSNCVECRMPMASTDHYK